MKCIIKQLSISFCVGLKGLFLLIGDGVGLGLAFLAPLARVDLFAYR
jgi:hypothetical protein